MSQELRRHVAGHQGLGTIQGRPRTAPEEPPPCRRHGPVGVLLDQLVTGARRYYDELRARDKTHRQAVRQLANRWAGILHAVLEQGCLYDEDLAWGHRLERAA